MEHCMEHSGVVERLDRDDKRIDEQGSAIAELTKISERLTIVEQTNSEMLKDHNDRLSTVEMQPAANFHELRGYLLSAAIGAAIAALPNITTLLR